MLRIVLLASFYNAGQKFISCGVSKAPNPKVPSKKQQPIRYVAPYLIYDYYQIPNQEYGRFLN